MRITISAHAAARMAGRGIELKDLRHVVANASVKVQRRDGRVTYQGEVAGRRLRVVVAEDVDPAVVVTAYWLDG